MRTSVSPITWASRTPWHGDDPAPPGPSRRQQFGLKFFIFQTEAPLLRHAVGLGQSLGVPRIASQSFLAAATSASSFSTFSFGTSVAT